MFGPRAGRPELLGHPLLVGSRTTAPPFPTPGALCTLYPVPGDISGELHPATETQMRVAMAR